MLVRNNIDRDLAVLALADTEHTQGSIRSDRGGDAAWLGAAVVSSSGLPTAQWNAAVVVSPAAFDADATAKWFAHRGVPWGALVPGGASFAYGHRAFTRKVMTVSANSLRHSSEGSVPRVASVKDLAALVRVDEAAFGASDPGLLTQWLEPHLINEVVTTAAIDILGSPIATGYVVVSDGRAGRTAHIGGIAVVPAMRRQGLAASVTTWLADRAFDKGAEFVHLVTDNPAAARLYTRLGFVEAATIDIYVDL